MPLGMYTVRQLRHAIGGIDEKPLLLSRFWMNALLDELKPNFDGWLPATSSATLHDLDPNGGRCPLDFTATDVAPHRMLEKIEKSTDQTG